MTLSKNVWIEFGHISMQRFKLLQLVPSFVVTTNDEPQVTISDYFFSLL